MGYNLSIGEAYADVRLNDRYSRIDVANAVVDGAPINSSDDTSNTICPSYSTFAEFCRETELYDVFFSGARGCNTESFWKDAEGRQHYGLLSQHPGAVALTESHLKAFQEAQERYQARGGNDEYTVKRLTWLVWWTEWALKNCKYPTFANC